MAKAWWPNGVVVGKDDDVGCSVFDAVAHLQAFIGKRNFENTYAFWIDLIGEVL